MNKNVASQKIAVLLLDSATGRPKTGDAANITLYVSKDYGTVTALTDTSATELSATNAPGWYVFDLSQAETNADTLLFSGKSTTSGCDVIGNLVSTLPANFTLFGIDTAGAVLVQARLKKNVTFNSFHFLMTDSTTHNPATGKTVTVTRAIDTGAFAAGTVGAVTEISDGMYRVDLPAADLNGNQVTLRMTASGCDALFVTLALEP